MKRGEGLPHAVTPAPSGVAIRDEHLHGWHMATESLWVDSERLEGTGLRSPLQGMGSMGSGGSGGGGLRFSAVPGILSGTLSHTSCALGLALPLLSADPFLGQPDS